MDRNGLLEMVGFKAKVDIYKPEPQKTLDSILSVARETITDLEDVASRINGHAFDKEEHAKSLLDDAHEDRKKAAHATIVADRMNTQINVSDKDIDALISKT